jgi:putative ABC transport system permease protein
LLLSVAGAALFLALASASSPLFLSSAGNAALAKGIEGPCYWGVGLQAIRNGPLADDPDPEFPLDAAGWLLAREQLLRRTTDDIPRLGPPVRTMLSSAVEVARTGADGGAFRVRLLSRTGSLSHVQRVSTGGGEGVWMPDTSAEALQVRPGDEVLVRSNRVEEGRVVPRRARVRVAGIYRDLRSRPLSEFWCSQFFVFRPRRPLDTPPPVLLADPELLKRIGRRLGERDATFTWEYPLRTEGLTLAEGEALAVELAQIRLELGTFAGGFRARSELPVIAQQAGQTVVALEGSVRTVSIAGTIVALVVVAAAGVHWVTRRRTEVALLSAQGVGPVRIAAKALLEGAIPVAVATAIGWAGTIWLVKLLGPSPLLEAGAPDSAARQVLWTAVLALCLLSAVAGVSARRDVEARPSRTLETLGRAPWEIPVLALAAASLYEILTRGTAPVEGPAGTPKVDALLLLFPILFLAGAAGLAARGVRRALPRLRTASRRWRPPLYLAANRLAGASRIAVVLVTASALSIGILTYAGSLASSVRATSEAKSSVFTGSDVAATLARDVPVPERLSSTSTKVIRTEAVFLPDQVRVDVLGVDPRTFARAAFWDESFASKGLQELLDGLSSSPSASAASAVMAGGALQSAGTLDFLAADEIRIVSVEFVRAFPGMRANRPVVVVDRRVLEERETGVPVLWARGEPEEVLRAIERAGGTVLQAVSGSEVQATPGFLSLSWTFGFLLALGVATGLIALVGTLLYLEARQRSREVSYALSRRMGLTRTAHRLAVALELLGLLAAGFIAGVTLSWLAIRVVYTQLDPMPQLPPPPLFRMPLLLLSVTAAALPLASALGAWWVQRTADRVNVAEVMRLAG